MTETYTHEEFFERARKGEFVGDKVTKVVRYEIDEVTQSGYSDEYDELEDDWSVGGERHCFWESTGNRGPTNTYEVERRA